MSDYKQDPLQVPLPPKPLTEDFGDLSEARALYEPGLPLEDDIKTPKVNVRVSLSGSADYPSVVAGLHLDDAPNHSVAEVLWTTVHWCYAVGVSPRSALRVYCDPDVTPTFNLGGLYRYAGLPYLPGEVEE